MFLLRVEKAIDSQTGFSYSKFFKQFCFIYLHCKFVYLFIIYLTKSFNILKKYWKKIFSIKLETKFNSSKTDYKYFN